VRKIIGSSAALNFVFILRIRQDTDRKRRQLRSKSMHGWCGGKNTLFFMQKYTLKYLLLSYRAKKMSIFLGRYGLGRKDVNLR
jgi:hypothetical protein